MLKCVIDEHAIGTELSGFVYAFLLACVAL